MKSETGRLSKCIPYSSGYREIEQCGAQKIVGRCGGLNHNWIQTVLIKEGRRERYEHTKAEVGREVPLLCASFQTRVAGGLYWLQQKNQLMTITFYFYREKYFIENVLLWPRALWASNNPLSIPKQVPFQVSPDLENSAEKLLVRINTEVTRNSQMWGDRDSPRKLREKKCLSYLGFCFQEKKTHPFF